MKYFARIDRKQTGPLSLTELVEAGVRPSTYVWCKGMADWQRAEDVPEICRAMRRVLAGCDPATGRPAGISDPDAESGMEKVPREVLERITFHSLTDSPFERDCSQQPRGVSIVLAVILTILCFAPTGVMAIFFAYKTRADWNQSLSPELSQDEVRFWQRKAHNDARLYRMMIGITICMSMFIIGFALMTAF